MAGTR